MKYSASVTAPSSKWVTLCTVKASFEQACAAQKPQARDVQQAEKHRWQDTIP